MMRFEGKVALVTGGASGIGAATVRRLVAEGAQVMIADLNGEGAELLATELGSVTDAHQIDVTDSVAVNELVRGTVDRFGGIGDQVVRTFVHAVRIEEIETAVRSLQIGLVGMHGLDDLVDDVVGDMRARDPRAVGVGDVGCRSADPNHV